MEQEIGKRIFTLRMRQGLTQTMLARGICDRSHISMIESGRTMPSIALLEKLAVRLSLTLPDLLGQATPPSREASFSFELLLDHLHALLRDQHYRDACILIRKQFRHPEVANSPDKLSQLHRLAGIAEALSDNEVRADNHFEKSEAYASDCRDRLLLLDIRISRAAFDNQRGDYAAAEARYRNAQTDAPRDLPLATRIKLEYGLGVALAGQGRHHPALQMFRTSLDRLMQQNSMILFGEIAHSMASSCEALGDVPAAIEHLQKAASFHQLSGDRRAERACYIRLATCYASLGQEAAAADSHSRARLLDDSSDRARPRLTPILSY